MPEAFLNCPFKFWRPKNLERRKICFSMTVINEPFSYHERPKRPSLLGLLRRNIPNEEKYSSSVLVFCINSTLLLKVDAFFSLEKLPWKMEEAGGGLQEPGLSMTFSCNYFFTFLPLIGSPPCFAALTLKKFLRRRRLGYIVVCSEISRISYLSLVFFASL